METGTVKTVEKKGLKFDLQATDEQFLEFNKETMEYTKRQIGIVITDLPINKFGIKRGSKMLISELL